MSVSMGLLGRLRMALASLPTTTPHPPSRHQQTHYPSASGLNLPRAPSLPAPVRLPTPPRPGDTRGGLLLPLPLQTAPAEATDPPPLGVSLRAFPTRPSIPPTKPTVPRTQPPPTQAQTCWAARGGGEAQLPLPSPPCTSSDLCTRRPPLPSPLGPCSRSPNVGLMPWSLSYSAAKLMPPLCLPDT